MTSVDIRIFISSEYSTSGSIYSAHPGVNQNFTVVPGVVTEVSLPLDITLQGGLENKGVRITSVEPIAVYGLNRQAASTDAFMAFPVNSLGTDYRVAAYIEGYSGISRISVVATEDNTVLSVFNHWTNVTSGIPLNQGQTWVSTDNQANGQDITGSRVQSNKPVAVFGSNDCVYIPDRPCEACDHIVEQMFPYYAWGKHFVTVPLAGRDNSGDLFRILAADDGTVISINGSISATINAGDHYQAELSGYNMISTSNPAMLAQFAKGQECSGNTKGDPLMMLIPPYEQFLTNYTVINLFGFYWNWVNVVAPEYALGTIYQDGVLIPDTAFTKVGLSDYYGAQRPVTYGSHNFTSIHPFGVFAYGWDQANSYGYPGGCSMSPVVNVESITLSPDTSYGQLNILAVCLTASVSDSLGNPLEGILVTFHVSGIGPLTGTVYTDSLGDALFWYIRSGMVPGTDNVYAEVSELISNTVVVFWSIDAPCINPTFGGIIGDDQIGCAGFTPDTLVNLASPSGYIDTLEYKWQVSTTDSISGFSDIPGSNSESFIPGIISQATWYKRIARVKCKSDWNGAAESNVIALTAITPLPVYIIISSSDTSVCEGTSVIFNATPQNGGTAPIYQWYVNGSPTGTNSPELSYYPADRDHVNCVLTSNAGCTSNNPAASDTIIISVDSILPIGVSISPSTNPICSGSLVIITATPENGGTTPNYQWWVNDINTGTNLFHYTFIPYDGDKVVCWMSSSYPCPDKPNSYDTLILVVDEVMKVVDSTMCFGIPYYAGGNWHTEPGIFIDTLSVPVECLRYIETRYSYKPPIPLDLGPDIPLCENTAFLDASIPGASYIWQDGSTESSYVVDSPGEYWVRITYDNCQVTDSISVEECPKLLMFPTAFSPNGDGLNDFFRPIGESVQLFAMSIFNRWGTLIFETTSMNPGWDGMYHGQRCPKDMYIYKVNYKTMYGESYQAKGYFTLTR